jgi:His Kinase A (phospho-acceptor) domain
VVSRQVVLLVCADAGVTQRFIAALAAAGENVQTPLVTNMAQAMKMLDRTSPRVILVDESAISPALSHHAPPERKKGIGEDVDGLEISIAALTQHAPVVLVAAAHYHEPLAFLIGSGAADLVARIADFVPVAAGLVARRMRLAGRMGYGVLGDDEEADFGELLRHEVNNPLTGILGNAELLLAGRDRLSPQAISRIETIAELAVRLRETVRRLSDTWASQHDPARIV